MTIPEPSFRKRWPLAWSQARLQGTRLKEGEEERVKLERQRTLPLAVTSSCSLSPIDPPIQLFGDPIACRIAETFDRRSAELAVRWRFGVVG